MLNDPVAPRRIEASAGLPVSPSVDGSSDRRGQVQPGATRATSVLPVSGAQKRLRRTMREPAGLEDIWGLRDRRSWCTFDKARTSGFT